MTEHNSSDNMQNRINNIFTGSDVPSPASLKEMESLRNRVRELEEQIKLQETETAKIKEEALQSSGSFGLYPSSDSLHRTATSKVNTQTVQKSWLPPFFTAPVFADDLEKTQSAKLLYQIITVVWAIPVILFLIWLFGNRPEAIGPAIIIAMGLLALMWLVRSGWVNLANGFMAMMVVLVFGYADYINAGNPQPSSLIIAVTIIMSGLLLGRRAPIATAMLIVLTHSVVVYLQMQGVIKLNSEPAVGFENMVITGGMTLVIGFLFQFVITRLQVSLERTRHNERELQVSNRELRELGVSLEKRVQDRTRDLELASEVGRTVTAKVNNLHQLLSDAVEQIRSRFNLYYTQVYLTDRAGRMITLRAGTGAVGKQLLQRGHQLLISSDSLNGRAALDKRAVIVLDTSKHPAFLPNPLLPKTRSEMTVPLIVGDQVIGVLDMQSDVPNSLNENNLPAFESLAGQLAVAIQNASLFEQANQARAEVIEQAKRLSLDNWDNFLNAVERSEKIGYVFNQNEVLPYLNQPTKVAEANTLDTPILVAGAEIGKIQIVDDVDRQWTVDESNLIQNTATQLANHIENLRLLAQSEKYRTEAEQVTKRLTREGWREYFATQKDQVNGFAYDQYQVLPLSENGHYAESLQTHPIYVRDEQVGELAIVQNESLNEETNEIITAVTQQLSNHIENLRLLEQAELSRIEVQKSQEQYELAVEGSNDGLWDWDIPTNQVYFSPRWKEMVGYGVDELNNGFADFEKLLHPEDHDRVMGVVGDYMAGKIPTYDTEFRFQHKNGSYRWIRARGKLLRNADGSPQRMAGSHTDITQLIESREKIKAVQEQYALAVEGSNDGLWDWDVPTNQVYFSPRWKEMVGYGVDELNGGFADFEKLLHPEDHDRVMGVVGDYMAGKIPTYDTEFRFQHKNGTYRWIRARGKLLRNADGSPQRMAGSHTDITQLIESREEIKSSQKRMQTILESVTIPMVITRLSDNTLTFINTPALEATQFIAEDVMGKPTPNFYYQVEQRNQFIAELQAKGEVDDMAVQILRADGQPIWVLLSARIFDFENEKSIITTFVDITERIHAQEAIAKRASELQTVAAVSRTTSTVLNPDILLQTVVDITKERFDLYHAHIYLLDENWNTLLLASGAGTVGSQMVKSGHAIDITAERSLVARSAREKQPVIINDVRSEVGFLPNPLLPETRAEMAVPMIVGETVLGVFDVQSNKVEGFSQEDANIFTTLSSQVAVALQNARLYQEQAATVTQLRELDRLKSSFLANMSHELRTPLNSILGFTEVMLEGLDGPLTPNMNNDLKLINKNGQHLLHLINDVLDMAKIESGKLNLIIEQFNIQEIFEEIINITSPLASERKLTLKIDPKSDTAVNVNADRTRLRQVMINLVNNALKFTEKGKVTIRAVREENNVLISIKDTGIGIPPQHLEDIFSEFTQVDSSTTRKVGGTGLGLPISRKLVEMHGGKLWAESNGIEGEGSTFFVFMPIENRSATSEPVTRKID